MSLGAGMEDGQAKAAGFEEFFRHWEPQLQRYLTWLESDVSIVEDAVQETMLSALRYWDVLRGYEQPRAWLFRVAGQRLSDERERRRASSLRWEVPDAGARASETAQVDDRIAVVELVRKLPYHQIAPVILYYLGFSDREIGETVGIAPSSARRYRCLGIRTLKDMVGDCSDDQEGCP